MIDLNHEGELKRAIELLFFAYREFTDRPDRILERRGLGRVHHRILYFVGRNPGISVGRLLEVLSVTKQALNTPLRQLSEMKLVAMAPDDRDRRVKRLTLSAEGLRLEAELTGVQMRALAAAFDEAGGAKSAGWTAVMELLARRER